MWCQNRSAKIACENPETQFSSKRVMRWLLMEVAGWTLSCVELNFIAPIQPNAAELTDWASQSRLITSQKPTIIRKQRNEMLFCGQVHHPISTRDSMFLLLGAKLKPFLVWLLGFISIVVVCRGHDGFAKTDCCLPESSHDTNSIIKTRAALWGVMF